MTALLVLAGIVGICAAVVYVRAVSDSLRSARQSIEELEAQVWELTVKHTKNARRINSLDQQLDAAKNTDVVHGAQLKGAGERLRKIEAQLAAVERNADHALDRASEIARSLDSPLD